MSLFTSTSLCSTSIQHSGGNMLSPGSRSYFMRHNFRCFSHLQLRVLVWLGSLLLIESAWCTTCWAWRNGLVFHWRHRLLRTFSPLVMVVSFFSVQRQDIACPLMWVAVDGPSEPTSHWSLAPMTAFLDWFSPCFAAAAYIIFHWPISW